MNDSAARNAIRSTLTDLGRYAKSSSPTMTAFQGLHHAVLSNTEGGLDALHKELIALAIGVIQGCSGCIHLHAAAALKAGATSAQLLSALDVAILMGGGPASIRAAEALRVIEQLQAA